MPAIQPALLKRQIDTLLQHFDTPQIFVLALKDLLDFYADRTRRPGGKRSKISLIRSYHVPNQVMRHIERALHRRVESRPAEGMELADHLWQETWLECRILAFLILGWIPPESPEAIMDRIRTWSQKCGVDRVLDASLARGIPEFWKSLPDQVIQQLESWLTSPDLASKKWGLRVVPALVLDSEFTNLPVIFRLLTPYVESVSTAPDTDLLTAVRALAQRTPQETAYFLQRRFTASENPGIYVLIRQSLDCFSPPTQQNLRSYLHQMREQYGEY